MRGLHFFSSTFFQGCTGRTEGKRDGVCAGVESECVQGRVESESSKAAQAGLKVRH